MKLIRIKLNFLIQYWQEVVTIKTFHTCRINLLYLSRPLTVVLMKVWCQWWSNCTLPTVLWIQNTTKIWEFATYSNDHHPEISSRLQLIRTTNLCWGWLENMLCRVEELQHQLAHQCSPNIIGIWEWGICGLMGGAFMAYWVGHLWLNGRAFISLNGWDIYGLMSGALIT